MRLQKKQIDQAVSNETMQKNISAWRRHLPFLWLHYSQPSTKIEIFGKVSSLALSNMVNRLINFLPLAIDSSFGRILQNLRYLQRFEQSKQS